MRICPLPTLTGVRSALMWQLLAAPAEDLACALMDPGMGQPIKSVVKIIPQQRTGKETNTSTSVHLMNKTDAQDLFFSASRRLQDVNSWHQYAGAGSARFQLYDEQAIEVFRDVKRGDYFRIDLPGPGTIAGSGNDWVQVRALGKGGEGEDEFVYFTVNATSDPQTSNADTAHFFGDKASSTFAVFRHHLNVTAGVYGRNESPNTKTRHFLDRIRNWLTAIGASFGFSKLQWKPLTRGLLKYH